MKLNDIKPLYVSILFGLSFSILMLIGYLEIIKNGNVFLREYPILGNALIIINWWGFVWGYGGVFVIPPFWFVWGGSIFYSLWTYILIRIPTKSNDEKEQETLKKKLRKGIVFIFIFPFIYLGLLLLLLGLLWMIS